MSTSSTNYKFFEYQTTDTADLTQINPNFTAIDGSLGLIPYALDTGAVNAYVVTLTPAPTVLTDGIAMAVKIGTTSTGASTINANGLGAKPIVDSLGNAIAGGALLSGSTYTFRYSSSLAKWVLQGTIQISKSVPTMDGSAAAGSTTLAADAGHVHPVDTSRATAAQGTLATNALPAVSYTAADVLTKIKTVAGTGSGLDADKLDGLDSTAFATNAQGTLAANALPSASYTAADVLGKIKSVDGAGSGLDADLLDGLASTAYATAAQGTLAANAAPASDLAAHKADIAYQTAGGTATAITLTIGETLSDGLPVNFKCASNNSAAATTINSKPLYKPGGTSAPNLIAGKYYTAVYNSAGACFFLKASAEGTAVAANVLAGTTFSNDSDTGLAGAMTNQGVVTITPGAVNQSISNFYASGSKVSGDANLVAANIPIGVSIFGVAGSRSNVKSLQRGTATFGSSATTVTATISAVDLTKAIVRISGIWTNNSGSTSYSAGKSLAKVVLTNATTVTITIGVASAYAPTVQWEVVEFNNVKSLQSGTLAISAYGLEGMSLVISSVTANKVMAFASGSSTDDTTVFSKIRDLSCAVVDSTHITITTPVAESVNWQVIEFN
jgi:hypothetical protein